MALNGIDSQIAAQRVTELSKDMGVSNRRSELMQEYISRQRKTDEEIQSVTVTGVEQKDDARINDNREGNRGNSREYMGGGSKKKQAPTEEASEGEQSVQPDNRHIIDITV